MSKLIVFSDLQAHTFKRFATLQEDGSNSRLEEAIKVLRYIRNLAQAENVYDILFCGDLFDAKGRTPILAINAVFREFQEWVKVGLNVLMIPGNHDFALRNGTSHALEVFKSLPGFVVIDEPQTFLWKMSTKESIFICAVPSREVWQKEWFEFRSVLLTDKTYRKICVGHGIVQGCSLDDAVTGQFGVIPHAWFVPYDISFVGDVHDPQVLRIHDDGQDTVILVPGCPWYQHPHENVQERGVWLVDLETKEMNLKKVPGCTRFAFLSLLKDGGIVQELAGKFSHACSDAELMQIVSGNIVMLKNTSIATAEHVLVAAKERCLSLGALGIEVSVEGQANEELMYAPRLDLSKYHTPKNVFQSVLYSGLVQTAGLDIAKLEQCGIQLLDEVQQSAV